MTASADTAGFGRHLAALSAIRLAGLGSSFLAAVVAARLLDPVLFGAAGVGQSLAILIAVVANGGLSMAAIYRLRRSESIAREVQAIVGLAFPLAVVAAIIATVGLGLGATSMGLPPDTGLIAAIVGLATATVMADVSGALLLGLGANNRYTVAEGLRYLTMLPLTFVALLILPSAAGYLAAGTAAVLIAAVFALTIVKRLTGTIRPRLDLRTWADALGFGLRGQPGNVLQYFSLRVDLILVGAIAGLAPAAVYLVMTRIAEVPAQIANSATSFLFPAVAQVGASNRLTVDVIRGVIVIVAAVSVGLAGVGPAILAILFGSPYDTGYPALLILLVASIPLSYARLLSGDIKGRGRPGLVSLASMIGVPITIVGDLLLVPRYGIVAAAVVSVVSYGATAIALARAYRQVSGIAAMELTPRLGDVGRVIRQIRNAVRGLTRPGGRAEPTA